MSRFFTFTLIVFIIVFKYLLVSKNMAIKDEQGFNRTSVYENRGKDPETKSYEKDFGHKAEKAAGLILDKAEGVKVEFASEEEDEFGKVDFYVYCEGFEDPIKVQFTTMYDPRNEGGELSSEQEDQLEKLKQKKRECGDEILFVQIPGRYFSDACGRLADPKEASGEQLVQEMAVDDKIEVLDEFYKSLQRESGSKADHLLEILKTYN